MPLSKILEIYAGRAHGTNVGYTYSGADLVICVEQKDIPIPMIMRLLHKESQDRDSRLPLIGRHIRTIWRSYEEDGALPPPRADQWVFIQQ